MKDDIYSLSDDALLLSYQIFVDINIITIFGNTQKNVRNAWHINCLCHHMSAATFAILLS